MLEGLVLESFTRMNQRRPPQSTTNPSELAVFRTAAIQTASMMFSILRRKVARTALSESRKELHLASTLWAQFAHQGWLDCPIACAAIA